MVRSSRGSTGAASSTDRHASLWKRPWRSLLGKSLLAVLAPLVLVLILGGIAGVNAVDRTAREVVTQRDAELARVAAARLSDRFATQVVPLLDAATDSVFTPPDPRRAFTLEVALANARRGRLAAFDLGAFVYTPDGVVVASDPPWLAKMPQWLDYPDRSQLRAVRSDLGPTASTVFSDPVTGVDFVMIAVPVLDREGELEAILVGGVSLAAPMIRDIAELRAGSTGSAYLVDEHGSVIFHRNPELIGRSLLGQPAVSAAIRGGAGAIVGEGSDGETTVSGFAPVPGTAWGVITEERWDTVIGPIRQVGRLALVGVVLGGVLAMLFLVLVMRRLLMPLGRLAEGADQIAAGELSHRVDTDVDDELRPLAERFNAMAATLQESYATLERRVEERTAENRQLYEEAAERAEELGELNRRAMAVAGVAQEVGALRDLDSLVASVGGLLRDTFGYSAADVYLLDDATDELVGTAASDGGDAGRRFAQGEGAVGRAAESRAPIIINELSREAADPLDTTSRSELAVPIRSGNLLVGVLDIRSPEPAAFSDADRFTAETFADQLGIAIENSNLFEQTRDLAVIEERNRFAREVHDTIAQGLTAIVLQLEALEQAMDDDPAAALEHLTRARDIAREALQDARRSVWNLLPERLAENSLDEALDREVSRFSESGPEQAHLAVVGRPRALRREVQTAVLRIGQEALMNARKHARASTVNVELAYLPGLLRLTVSDDGRGLHAAEAEHEPGSGFGIRGMQQRARQLFGSLDVRPRDEGSGTIVEAIIPAD